MHNNCKFRLFYSLFLLILTTAFSTTAVASISELIESAGLSPSVAKTVEEFYETHGEFNGHIGVIDFGAHSSKKRLFLFNLMNNTYTKHLVAHGRNSDLDNDGFADAFSNIDESKMSSLGFMLGSETYFGKYGYSLRLDGLEEVNDLVRDRDIVIHPATYVNEKLGRSGRSWGCPALDKSESQYIINSLKDGGLIYSFHPQYPL